MRDFPMSRNQASQLFNKCFLKGWLQVEQAKRRPRANDSFKFYILTEAGEKHGENIPPDND